MNVEIRRLTAADVTAYKSLRDATLAAEPTAFTSDAAEEATRSPESYANRLGDAAHPERTYTLGAWLDGELLGALTCERDSRTKVRHVGHLVGMMVTRTARGRGIGAALLSACLEESRASGTLTLLALNVTAGNDPAIRLYERFGFSRYGRLERAIRVDDAYHAKEQMALLL